MIAPILLAMVLTGGDEPSVESSQAAVAKALPLLSKGMAGHVARRSCFACHQQALPVLAITTAFRHKMTTVDVDRESQIKVVADFLAKNREQFVSGKGTGGKVDTAGYALWTLEMGGWKQDETTDAVVDYIMKFPGESEFWKTSSNRPPSEASSFTTTYLAIRALKKYGHEKHQETIQKRLDSARAWMLGTAAKDTEDRVFRLWGLKLVGADAEQIKSAALELSKSQRDDGGWSQLEGQESDSYATGTALVSLYQAGEMKTSDSVYRKGVAFLLKTQKEDGSWFVHSRSKPFQAYYESGFPHGKHQFISIAASGWATAALAQMGNN